jgi:hypothetical protein
MRRVLCSVLGLAGLAGLLLFFLACERHGGQGNSVFRIGRPDAWYVWESHQDGGWHYEISLLRWSMGIGVAGVYALYYSVRLARRPAALGSSNHAEPGART